MLVAQWLFFLLILFIPSNLFLIIGAVDSYVNGLQVDYLMMKLYASGLLVMTLLSIWFLSLIKRKKVKHFFKNIKQFISHQPWISLLFTLLILRQLVATQPLSAIAFCLQLATAGLFLFFLQHHSRLTKQAGFFWAVFASLLLQTSLAVYQFSQQRPLLPYYLLGEPRFEPYFRLARHLFAGKEKVLSYGATAHPNVLAGVSVIFFLLLWQWVAKQPFKDKKSSKKFYFALVFSLLAVGMILYTTQSLAALLTLIIVGCYFSLQPILTQKIKLNLKQKVGALLVILVVILAAAPLIVQHQAWLLPTEPSLTRRSELNQAAWSMFQDHWWGGVGLNQFTLYLEEYAQSKEAVRFVQPVHHLGLLWLAETGVLGIGLVMCSFGKLKQQTKKKLLISLLLVSPILVLDHYLYTLQAGQLLLILYLGNSISLNRLR